METEFVAVLLLADFVKLGIITMQVSQTQQRMAKSWQDMPPTKNVTDVISEPSTEIHG